MDPAREKQFFPCRREALLHLKARDAKLAAVIDRLGEIKREVMPDLFEALVHTITGQQISTKAHVTVMARLREAIGAITPGNIADADDEALRSAGISARKVSYIRDATEKMQAGFLTFGPAEDDETITQRLLAVRGIGIWSSEMLLLFSLQRQNVLSFGDLGIRRGLEILHGHRCLTRPQFDIYRRRYAPYGSTASLYLWEIAAGR